jgi:DNA-binding response OmpR family regulator
MREEGDASYASGVPSIAAGSLAVELLPEGTSRLGSRTPIGPRLAFVVDRTPSIRTIHSTLMQVHGFSVETFATLDDARGRCADVCPDVVVMEPRAMGVDAMDVLREWHDAVAPAAPPVVWCTTVTPTQQHLDTGARLGLRGVVIKPFRLEALMALVVRVVRTHERESRLRKMGVDLRRLVGPLSPDAARMWLRVETELSQAHSRPLSLVCMDGATPELQAAVRSVIRNVDLMALLDGATLAVLLPDVDATGTDVVARRVSGAAGAALGTGAAVWTITRGDGESPDALLERAIERG